MVRTVLVASLALLIVGCGGNIVPDFRMPVVCRITAPIDVSLFLAGDAGDPDLPPAGSQDPNALVDPLLGALAEQVAAAVAARGSDRTAVLYLGDNVYEKGMPPEGDEERAHAEQVLNAQIAAAGEARVLFILGNHDWNQNKKDGWVRARAQFDFLSTRAPNVTIHPPETCPGPDFVDLGNGLRIVFFDLWAAMFQIENPDGPQAHCSPHAGEGRLISHIDELFASAGDRRVILAAHSPILSAGPHGGYFPWKEHVFPLRVFNRHLWIPLPILGSIFPLSRMLGVTEVDIMNSQYGQYVREAYATFKPGLPALVVAGHEHSLQVHLDPNGIFHAVSGAGSTRKVDYVRHDMKTELMGLAAPGFMRLDVHEDGRMRLNVIALGERTGPRRVYSTCIP